MSRNKRGAGPSVGIGVQVDPTTHWLLKIYCMEERVTLKEGIAGILKQRMEHMHRRMGEPPWARTDPALRAAAPDALSAALPETKPASRETIPPPAETAPPQREVEDEPEDDDPWAEEKAAFNPQKIYDERIAKGLPAKSALTDALNAIEFYGLEYRFPDWQPGAPAVPKDAIVPPLTAREYDIPPAWVDNSGHTRKQNVERFGEDLDMKYWPPPPPRPGEDRV